MPDRVSETSAVAVESDASVREREIAENETLYSVLREQSVRDDAALLAAEQQQQLNAATVAALTRVAQLQNQLRKLTERLASTAKTAPAAAPVPNIETTLRVSVKLVPVTVVMRDSKGNAVGNLHKEDFRLFDNGSPQVIKSFSMERSATARVEKSESAKPGASVVPANNAALPDRYVAYLFDDVHTAFEDLASAREAARHRLSALRAQDRVAIFTTSGQDALDFTSDRDKLQQSLLALRPHPLMRGTACPPISHYMADLIVNQDDREALGLATMDTINCAFAGMRDLKERAEQIAKATAFEVLNASSSENGDIKHSARSISPCCCHARRPQCGARLPRIPDAIPGNAPGNHGTD